MKKQTAVEWFFEQIMYADVDIKVWKEILDQAKAMEKMQIIEAYEQGEIEWSPFDFKTAQDYYNRTFNK